MHFIRNFFEIHIRDNMIFYLLLTLFLSWNYFMLDHTIPFYIYNALIPWFGQSLIALICSNIIFILFLSLLFIYPNKEMARIYEFNNKKNERTFFWICQSISVVIIILFRQVYEFIVLFLN